MEANDAAKYLDDGDCSPPYAVVAPYFYLTETTYADWLPILTRAASYARAFVGDSQKVFVSIVVDQGVLVDESARETIDQAFAEVAVDGFVVWADNLDEQAASILELSGWLDLVQRLRNDGSREVINLHGGYFSILAAGAVGRGRYFTGVTHGPEFGEFRGVVPVGGGIPIARYYIPRLHSRVRYRDALRILNEMEYLKDAMTFHEEVCKCEMCRKVISGNIENFALFGDSTVKSVRRKHGIVRIDFPTGDTKLRCLSHYLQRKKLEYDAANTLGSAKLLAELEDGVERYKEAAGLEAVSHLRVWHRVLTGN
jgi:hypothetical protein